jgi:hypothetical protein
MIANFTAVRTFNQGSFVGMLTKLLTLEFEQRLFNLAAKKWLGSNTDGFRSSEKFTDREMAKVCSHVSFYVEYHVRHHV